VQAVSKRYGRGPWVIENLTLEIAAGEFLAVVGPSGCGKTTLLNLIGGLDQPDSGRVVVDDRDLGALGDCDLSRFRNASVGFIFQTFHLHPRLSALENVMLPLLIAGASPAQAGITAGRMLDSLGLDDVPKKRPGALSGGQMQRVAIARALVMEPPVLLADEPTGNLDEDTGREILGLIADLNRRRGLTVVLVTHEPQVRQHATRVRLMSRGRLREEG
jgi:putative ABC transport system ATP-binding protein